MICRKCSQEVPDAPYCCQCGTAQQITRAPRRRGNGTGTAIKRGKTWTVIVPMSSHTEKQADGTIKLIRHRKTKGGFATKKEALEYGQLLMSGKIKDTPTLTELWEGWSTNDMLKLSESKQVAYKLAWGRLTEVAARDIKTLTIDDLQTTLNNNCTSYYTARDVKSLLSKLFQRAMANKLVEVNLSKFLVLPELEEKEAQPFTQDEVSKLWSAYNGGDVFVGYTLLMIYSGMMPSELKACEKGMIDREKCEIWGCGKKTTKRKKEIPIVFPDFMIPVIDTLCDYSKTNMLLSYGHNQFYDKYHETLKSLGIRDLPPYSCRHTYGTEAIKGKNSPEVVRQMLRHATIYMQQRYTHLSSEQAHEAANSLQIPKSC